MAPYQRLAMAATKEMAEAKSNPKLEAAAEPTQINHGLYEVGTKDGFDALLRVLVHSPFAIQEPLIQGKAESTNTSQAGPRISTVDHMPWDTRKEALKFYNRGGQSLQQVLS